MRSSFVFKKSFAIILVLLLTASLMPLNVFATTPDVPPANSVGVDNGVNLGALGFSSSGYQTCLNRLQGLSGKTISTVWFYYGREDLGTNPGITEIAIKIYDVDSSTSLPGVELYSQTVDVTLITDYGWYRIELTTPFLSEADTLFVGVYTVANNHSIIIGRDNATDGGSESYIKYDTLPWSNLANYNFKNNYMIRTELSIEYIITINPSLNGSITSDKSKAVAGDTVNLTVTPNEGYALVDGSLKVNGVAVTGTSFTMTAADATITAEFEAIDYNITVGSLTNGTVTADKTTANIGDTVNLTVTPADGYNLVAGSLKVNGVAITGTSFTMTAADATITAEFEAIDYNITVGSLTNGTVTADKTMANIGDTVNLTVTPADGYNLVAGSLKVNGVAVTGTSFTMTAADATITAEFEAIDYNITVDSLTNGTVTADKTMANIGDTVNLTVTPADGYNLVAGSLKVNGVAVTGTSFTMTAADATITAEFEAIDYNITVSSLTNGTVTADKTMANIGDTVNLTVTPAEGYALVDGSLKVNEEAITGTSFTMTAADATITAEFVLEEPSPDTSDSHILNVLMLMTAGIILYTLLSMRKLKRIK
ncbi:MAG: hypothetical protein PHV95_11185 [Eubacteriales bacterium]|nr:hypothetical protein [Eubacteriales bacterium]